MDYDQTTVMFTVNFIENGDKKDIIGKLEKIKNYILQKSELYGFRLYQNDEVVDGTKCEGIFNDYIKYISDNIKFEDGGHFLEDAGPYACSEWPDLEEHEMEYDQSLCLGDHSEYATIFVTMRQFYASEIAFRSGANSGTRMWGDANIGISCQMVDIDGDWYEFDM